MQTFGKRVFCAQGEALNDILAGNSTGLPRLRPLDGIDVIDGVRGSPPFQD